MAFALLLLLFLPSLSLLRILFPVEYALNKRLYPSPDVRPLFYPLHPSEAAEALLLQKLVGGLQDYSLDCFCQEGDKILGHRLLVTPKAGPGVALLEMMQRRS